MKLLSIAQDIIFLSFGNRRPIPKHIEIGVTVHQATHSKDLVQILHAAGNSISYESVLSIDTLITNDAVQRYMHSGEVFLPFNFIKAHLHVPGYTMHANDNIDISEETFD